MPNWRRVAILLVVLPTVVSLSPVMAQNGEDACPVLVETALAAVGDACEGLSRNEACYGHTLVTATDWDQAPLEGFERPGDLVNVFELASLATFPMDVEQESWGIALLRLQADLPDTLPGQGVTFVLYGDAELRSDVPPETLNAPTPTPFPTCAGTPSGGTNLRTGPGTNHTLAGSVGAGEEFTVSGRDASGDWLRVEYRDQYAWVFAPLLSLDCDADTLSEVAADSALERAYTAPLQAFYLVTGLGEPACREAPRDGLLVQAPRQASVHFMINGVAVTVGSTALLQIDEDTLGVNTFDGAVDVTSAGRTQTAAPGQRVDAITGEAPAPPVPYDPEDVANAPVELLPEPVDIPPPASETELSLQPLGTISIPSRSEGTRYTAEMSGTHRFRIEGGAIQNCPPGADLTNPYCNTWTAHVLIYLNREIVWARTPTAWDYQLGDASPVGTAAEAIARNLGAYVDIPLAQGDYVIIAPFDSQGDYVDNLGELTLSVSLVGYP